MAKHDWKALQAEFTKIHLETGISAKDWCEKVGLNYTSARRHIKRPPRSTVIHANEVAEAENTEVEAPKPKSKPMHAFKHGGYSKYFNADIQSMVSATELTDELELCRSRIHLVVGAMEQIQNELQKRPSLEVATSLYDSLFKAEQALDRNIVRVESITRTISALKLDRVNYKKIVADTEKSKKAAELIGLNIDKVRKEIGGTSKLDQYIDKLTGGDVDQVVG